MKNTTLVGGWTNPFEKYARQIGSFPQVGTNMKKYIWNHHLVVELEGILDTYNYIALTNIQGTFHPQSIFHKIF